VLIRLYDVAIVVPLLVERLAKGARRSGRNAHLDVEVERTHALGNAMDRRRFLVSVPALALAACGDARSHRQAVYMLVDTSGTYARRAGKAVLDHQLPCWARCSPAIRSPWRALQSRSFSEKDIIAKATFDARPSQANAQKRAFHAKIDSAFRNVTGSRFTDITGGLIQAAEFLNEGGAGTQDRHHLLRHCRKSSTR